jgi:hypothetical protein
MIATVNPRVIQANDGGAGNVSSIIATQGQVIRDPFVESVREAGRLLNRQPSKRDAAANGESEHD